MKRLLLLGLIILGMVSCQKEPLPIPPDPLKDPKLELEVEEVGKTSVKVSTKVDPGSYSIVSQGVCYDRYQLNPTTENQTVSGAGSMNLVNLEPGSRYYVRAYASTQSKTYYGSSVEVNTKDIVVSVEVSDIGYREAKVTISIDEAPSIIERGIIYSQESDFPTTNSTTFKENSVELKLLDYEAKYYVKAYAKFSDRIVYSSVTSFSTAKLETVTDYDGNVYRVIEMPSTKGPRLWLLDNFKGTHFANGDPIPNVTDDEEWTKLESAAYCYYDNNKDNAKTYGALYNWWAAVDPRGLIPGWHTPSDEEWFEMSDCIHNEISFGEDLRGQKLKQAGTSHWQAPNTGATNETGFTALPAGGRSYLTGEFFWLKTFTIFVSSTEIFTDYWAKRLYHNRNDFNETASALKGAGSSIRLIKTN